MPTSLLILLIFTDLCISQDSSVRKIINIRLILLALSAVYHSEDLLFVFMATTRWKPAIEKGLVNRNDYIVADYFADTWTNFAKYSQPTLDNSWPAVDSSKTYMDINPNPVAKKNYRQVDYYLWNKALPPLIGNWPPERPDYGNGTTVFEFDWSETERLLSELFHK